MKKILLMVAVLIATTAKAKNTEYKGDFYKAIATVESNNNDQAVGDKGRAVGRYQIWKIVVDDVNRIIGKKHFTYEDRKDPIKAKQMCAIYIAHYSRVYERKTGKKATAEIKARIWNGGPNGWRKESTQKYWNKVKACL